MTTTCREACPPGPVSRRGLTLVELLVVVSIIAMLVGLLTPALMGARRSALNAKVKSEIDMLHMALMNYKNEYGSFPPANFGSVPNNVGPLWVGGDDGNVNKRHPVYRHLVRIFPRMQEDAAFQELASLSPAQALVFWLQGFYENPAYPLTNKGQPGKRKKLYDFDSSRLYAAEPYLPNQPQTFKQMKDFPDPTVFQRKYPVYFTGQPTSGLPYVYFDARCYDLDNSDLTYRARSASTGEESVAAPYITSDIPLNPLWSQLHVNPDTFQLIASGIDGRYGPLPGPEQSITLETHQASFPRALGSPFVRKPADLLSGHGDNLTNFAPKPLADSITALTNAPKNE